MAGMDMFSNRFGIASPVSNLDYGSSQQSISVFDQETMATSLDFGMDSMNLGSQQRHLQQQQLNATSPEISRIRAPQHDIDTNQNLSPTQNSNPFTPCYAATTAGRDPQVDSDCVLACCQIISTLENYLMTNLRALDIILGVIRESVDALNRIMNLQQDSRAFRCHALMGAIMYQIIELLEAGCNAFLAESTHRVPAGLDKLPSIAGFGIGLYQIGGGVQQRQWRAQAVLKEVQQANEILQRVVALQRLGHEHERQGAEKEACHADLERRLRQLGNAVARVGSQ
jgi:hypothetical protein